LFYLWGEGLICICPNYINRMVEVQLSYGQFPLSFDSLGIAFLLCEKGG